MFNFPTMDLGIGARDTVKRHGKPANGNSTLVPFLRENFSLSEIAPKGKRVLDNLLTELSLSVSERDYLRMSHVQLRLLLMLADYDRRRKTTECYHERYFDIMMKYSTMH